MTSTNTKKRFGLILASARRAQAASVGTAAGGGVRKLNPLRDSDEELEEEEEEQDSMDWVQAALKKSGGGNSAQLAQQQRLMREALEQDVSVFQYDELYDGMQAERDAARQDKQERDRKPKYIPTILKCAERRKLEKERRTERKVHAEREAEKGLYDDKESFVTTSYLKKLEELKKAEAQEKLELMIEEKNDVSKHKNMGIFYNHLFKQRMGESTAIKKEPEDTATTSNRPDGTSQAVPEDVPIKRRDDRSRANQYRRREAEDSPASDAEASPVTHEVEHSEDSDEDAHDMDNRSKRKRHRSHSVSPMRGNRSRSPVMKQSTNSKISHGRRSRSRSPSRRNRSGSRTPSKKKHESLSEKKSDEHKKLKEQSSDITENKENSEDSKKSDCQENLLTKEERIKKLFTKRTVGEVFIEAQQRYFVRKSERADGL